MKKKYLIVNADDYNLTEGVSRGIVTCFREGIVTSTTFMVNLPVEKEILSLLANNNISAGIHFNLTFGRPLSDIKYIPDLVDPEGKFFRDFSKRVKKDMVSQVLIELKAQYERAMDLGFNPVHFDSHHHVHTAFELKDLFFDFALEKKLPLRSLNGLHRKEAYSKNIITTDDFYDSFYGSEATFSALEKIISSLSPGVAELMCHPGYSDGTLCEISSYNDSRVKELDILCSSELFHLLKKFEIELINYSDLVRFYG